MPNDSQKIEIRCPKCQAKYRLPRSAAGRTAKCKCGIRIAIPKSIGSAGAATQPVDTTSKATTSAEAEKSSSPRPSAIDPSASKRRQKAPTSPTTQSVRRTPVRSETEDDATILGAADIIPEEPPNPVMPTTPPSSAGDDWLDNMDLPAGAAAPASMPITPHSFNPYSAPSAVQPVGQAPIAAPATNQTCAQHPTTAAPFTCMVCGEGVCKTCLFEFPDGTICCPTCATDDTLQQSIHRKGMLFGGVACAVFASCFLAMTLSGLLQELAMMPFGGVIIEAGISVPIIMGLGVSVGAYNSYEGNPVLLWVGAIWNGILLLVWAGLILLIAVMGAL